MIVHYLLPKSKEDRIEKNKCNGSIAPERVCYIYLEHFLDKRFKRITEDQPRSPKKKKGQEMFDFPYD
jgi:hypothetical protein